MNKQIRNYEDLEKEKLRLMADRVVKNINTQSSMLVQSKETEITTLKEIVVQL